MERLTRAHHVGVLRRRYERRCGAGAGAEVADPEVSRIRVL
jgi:hypothetical protein